MPTIDDASIDRLEAQLIDSQDKLRISSRTSNDQLSKLRKLAESLFNEMSKLAEIADDLGPVSANKQQRLEESRRRISLIQQSLQENQQAMSEVMNSYAAILKQEHDELRQMINNLRP